MHEPLSLIERLTNKKLDSETLKTIKNMEKKDQGDPDDPLLFVEQIENYVATDEQDPQSNTCQNF